MTPQEAVVVIERQLAATRLAWADAMLAAGRGGDAEAAVAELSDGPEVQDLRARIAMQRGAESEAADLWQTILARDPEHRGAREGQALLARNQHRRSLRRVTTALATSAAVIALLLICYRYWTAEPPDDTPARNIAPPATDDDRGAAAP